MGPVRQWPLAREKAYSGENTGVTMLLGIFIDSSSPILQVPFAPVLQTPWLRSILLLAKAKRAGERRCGYRLQVPSCLDVTASGKREFYRSVQRKGVFPQAFNQESCSSICAFQAVYIVYSAPFLLLCVISYTIQNMRSINANILCKWYSYTSCTSTVSRRDVRFLNT